MAQVIRAVEDQHTASLLAGIVEDTQKLMRQELALAQREAVDALTKAKLAGALLGGALTLIALSGFLFGFTLVKLLQLYLLPNHEWACFAIVACLAAASAGGLYRGSLRQWNQVHLVPQQTVETLQQDVQAVTGALSADRSIGSLSH